MVLPKRTGVLYLLWGKGRLGSEILMFSESSVKAWLELETLLGGKQYF
jgi:hypothetical protein